MYSLKDVLKQYFDKLDTAGKLKICTDTDNETRFLNFYSDKVKCFKEIIHVFDIEAEMEELKKLTSNNYAFSERNKNFVIMLFNNYAGKLDTIRRGQIYLADSDFIIAAYEGFIDVFMDAGAERDLIKAVSLKMINRLNVPMHKLQSIREYFYKNFEEMIKQKTRGYTLGINIMEYYQWLLSMEVDIHAFITKWEDLFDIMSQLRTEEINSLAEKEALNMSDNEIYEADIDLAYSEEIAEAVDLDEEYQNLQVKRCKMLGLNYEKPRQKPVTINDILDTNQKVTIQKKRPFVKDVEKKFYEVNARLQARFNEIRTMTIRKHIPNYELLVEEDDIDFSSLISTEELLKKAIEELKEDWELRKKQKNRTLVELPDIDFDELRKKTDYIP